MRAVTFNKEWRRNAVILPDDLPERWKRAHALPSAMRCDMHILGLLSGLRPGTLVSSQRDWVRLKDRAISIPKMKAGRPFDLLLSEPMVECLQRLLALADIMYPKAPWLFLSRLCEMKATAGSHFCNGRILTPNSLSSRKQASTMPPTTAYRLQTADGIPMTPSTSLRVMPSFTGQAPTGRSGVIGGPTMESNSSWSNANM